MLALGLGIGANTAIFSIFNGILWRPLPVQDPQQLVVLVTKTPGLDFPTNLSYPDFQDYRQLKAAFSDLVAFTSTPVNFGAEGRPERAWADLVTGNYFSMLGLEAVCGRTFAGEEGWVPRKDPLIVLGYKFWQRRFGGDPAVVGRTALVNQHRFTILGVAPEGYHGAYYFLEPDFYLPLTTLGLLDANQADDLNKRSSPFLHVLGRLQPGVAPAQAAAAAEPTARRLAQEFSDSHKDMSLLVMPELSARPEPGLGGFMSTAVVVFMALVGLVLLIACANVANLILARANGRRKEIATRTALGASRWRMMRQLLTESVLLALCGGVVGLIFARWAALALMSIHIPTEIPLRLFDLGMDWRIFAFSFIAALMTGVAAGMVPALQTSRRDVADVLKAGGRSGGASTGHHRFRNALVFYPLAELLVELLPARLAIALQPQVHRHHQRVVHAESHIDTRRILKAPDKKPGAGQQQQRHRHLGDAGARGASFAAYIPMGYDNSLVNVFPEGQVIDEKSKAETAFDDEVQPDYFGAAGVPVVEGREFSEADTAASPKVAIVNDTFAKKIWPGQDALGKVFRTEKNGPAIQVVGLTRTGKYLFLYETPQLFVYFPLAQHYVSGATLMVHSEDDPQRLTAPVREQIRQLDAGLPVFDVKTMEAHVRYGKPLLPARLGAMLAGAFGVLGLVLASVGVYGVVSYSVSQRTQEIGIRTALGAQRWNVLGLVLKQGMTMALIGTCAGVALALLLFRGLHSVLYGVESTDLVTLASVSVLLLIVAFAASSVPALRAAQVDPVVALREQ